MLVLTRKIGEEIIIDGNIRIKIVSMKGDRIRIGIDAPQEVAVHRAEIQERHTQPSRPMAPAGVCDESVDLGASRTVSMDDTTKH